jgi:hypothetical protein
MDRITKLQILEIFDLDRDDELGRMMYFHEANCERVEGRFHNQVQHYGGFDDE